MPDLIGWARDLLQSRGALVEMPEGEALQALLPPEVSRALGSEEWLSLDFGAAAGADDPGEWLERLGKLLEPGGSHLVSAVRLRAFPAAGPVDAAAILDRELVIQNGVHRLVEDCAATAAYYLFTFQYTVESDDRRVGLVTVGLNATAQSWVPAPERLLSLVHNDLEDDPGLRALPAELSQVYTAAARAARVEIRPRVAGLEATANRRLARDVQRVESYYRGLLETIQKRIARRSSDAGAVEKERSRAQATELDRAAKLEDLRRKYSLRVATELTDVLVVTLPVRAITARLMRKKEERRRTLHWNTVLRRLEPPWCENCATGAHPLYLCEGLHCLCRSCWSPCPACGKFFCPVCRPRCRCGAEAGAAVPRQPASAVP